MPPLGSRREGTRVNDPESIKALLADPKLKGVIKFNLWKYSCYIRGAVIDRNDLEQEAWLGAYRAAETFDPAKSSFTTYANLWIRSGLRDLLASASPALQIPERLWGESTPVFVESVDDHGAESDPGFAKRALEIAPPPPLISTEEMIDLERALDRLPLRQKNIVHGTLRGKTLREIGAAEGCTWQNAKEHSARALKKIVAFVGPGGVARSATQRRRAARESGAAGTPTVAGSSVG